MRALFVALVVCLIAAPGWTQTAKQPQPNPQGQPGGGYSPQDAAMLSQNGFTDAEIKTIADDLKAMEKKMREIDADVQVLMADRNRLMLKDKIDRNAVQNNLRQTFDSQFQAEWTRLSVLLKWKDQFSEDKFAVLQKRFFQPAGPSQAGAPQGQMGGPQGQMGAQGQPGQPGPGGKDGAPPPQP